MQANLFGQFLLEHGTIDSDQLKQALDYQRAHNRVLGELAVEMGLLDEEGISRIIEHQRHVDKDFGGVAVKLGLMSEDNLDELLREQQRSHLRLGDVLVRLDLLREQELKSELQAFEEIRGMETQEALDEEKIFKENPALGFFNLASKVLPRMTRGLFLPGGFYPTIAYSEYGLGFSQSLQGDLNMEAVLIVPLNLFPILGESILRDGGKLTGGKSKIQYERSVKNLIDVIMRLFIQQQEKFGLKLKLPVAPRKIKETTYLKHKNKAQTTTFVEVFLISPHDPSGDLYEFYMGVIFK